MRLNLFSIMRLFSRAVSGALTTAIVLFTAIPALSVAQEAVADPAVGALQPASSESASSAAVRFTQKLEALSTMSGTFSQQLSDGNGKEIQQSAGTFLVKRPGLFRWETKPPFEQSVISDGKQVYIYDPDLEQVTITKQSQTDGSPASILSGDIATLEKFYLIKSKQLNGNKEAFALTSRSGNMDFSTVIFSFDGNVIESLEVVDRAGQKSRISFSEIKINRLLDEANFTFSAPEGVDIIRQ